MKVSLAFISITSDLRRKISLDTRHNPHRAAICELDGCPNNSNLSYPDYDALNAFQESRFDCATSPFMIFAIDRCLHTFPGPTRVYISQCKSHLPGHCDSSAEHSFIDFLHSQKEAPTERKSSFNYFKEPSLKSTGRRL